ncbi:lytic transglycosylase domain-containing protein [Marinobacterium sp. YM272]|uniref:lytic transglycosylase domain-containing protein n=1 Tax=Marinobacterium sp. YM272 TaxID=3421654 RepID=UPI003D7F73C6
MSRPIVSANLCFYVHSHYYPDMKKRLPALTLTAFIALSLTSASAFAEDIRRVVHPDGRVEYTNLAPKESGKRLSGSSRTETIYKYRRPDGTLAFSDERPLHIRNYDVLKFDCYACAPGSTIDWHTTPLNRQAFRDQVSDAAKAYGVAPSLVRAVIHAESAFNPKALSHKGAMGLMQLMPATAEDLGVSNALDEQQNIQGGVRYLAALLERYDGDSRLATAAYNAGPGAVAKYGGVPPYAETKAYVERVGILQKRYAQVQ